MVNLSKKLSLIGMVLVLLNLFFMNIFADTNGVWVKAEDMVAGTFGGDEQVAGMSYRYINPVYFMSGEIGIGTITPTAKLDIIGDVKAHNIFSNGVIVATQNNLTDLANNVANNYFNKTQSDARYVNEG